MMLVEAVKMLLWIGTMASTDFSRTCYQASYQLFPSGIANLLLWSFQSWSFPKYQPGVVDGVMLQCSG